MDIQRIDYQQLFAGRFVQYILMAILGTWILLDASLIPEILYAPLAPLWAPSYLAFAVADTIRAANVPGLGYEPFFDTVTILVMYIEAVLIAAVVRYLWESYHAYQEVSDSAKEGLIRNL